MCICVSVTFFFSMNTQLIGFISYVICNCKQLTISRWIYKQFSGWNGARIYIFIIKNPLWSVHLLSHHKHTRVLSEADQDPRFQVPSVQLLWFAQRINCKPHCLGKHISFNQTKWRHPKSLHCKIVFNCLDEHQMSKLSQLLRWSLVVHMMNPFVGEDFKLRFLWYAHCSKRSGTHFHAQKFINNLITGWVVWVFQSLKHNNWTSHSYVVEEHLSWKPSTTASTLPWRLSMRRTDFGNVAGGICSRSAMGALVRARTDVGQWSLAWQSVFQLVPKVLDGVEVRPLCRSVKFFYRIKQ